MELIRRVMVAVGVLAAVWCAVRARPLLVRVSARDGRRARITLTALPEAERLLAHVPHT